jgi:hypothetical protein
MFYKKLKKLRSRNKIKGRPKLKKEILEKWRNLRIMKTKVTYQYIAKDNPDIPRNKKHKQGDISAHN